MTDFIPKIDELFAGYSATQRAALNRFITLLYETNAVMNLTRVPEQIAVERHLVDSAVILPEVDAAGAKSIIDIGTGAGLPGVVLAILRPDIKVTMVESIKKKAGFVANVLAELQLTNAAIVAERAENLGRLKDYAGRFDLVTARAVASVKELISWCKPFMARTGCMIFQKGPKLPEELREAQKIMAAQKLEHSTREYTISGEAFSVLKLTSKAN